MKTVLSASSTLTINEFGTEGGTSFGHSAARGGLGVGAADYRDTPAFGQSPALIEDFSSAGGTPILFDTAGNRLATPEVRAQPAITAPDGADTTFFGGSDPDATGFRNFFGTSAAAPHAAGIAALITDLNPSIGPDAVYSVLKTTAVDMDDPTNGGFDTGFDFVTGFGLIQADAALAAVAAPPPPPPSPPSPPPRPAPPSAIPPPGPGSFPLVRPGLAGFGSLPGPEYLMHQPGQSHRACQCPQARKWPRNVGQGAEAGHDRRRGGQCPAGSHRHLPAPAHQQRQEDRQEEKSEETQGKVGGEER